MKSAYIFFNPKSGKDEQALAQEVKSYLIEHDFQDDYVRIITPSSLTHYHNIKGPRHKY